jgi:hypothetical protein
MNQIEAVKVEKKSTLTPQEKVEFDPQNKDHLKDYAYFVKHRNWKNGCRYVIEEPFETLPSMINHKIAMTKLKTLLKKV